MTGDSSLERFDDPTRASGLTQSEEVSAEEFSKLDDSIGSGQPSVPGLSDKESSDLPLFRRGNTGFMRMKVGVDPDDRAFMQSVQSDIDKFVVQEFADAYQVMNDLLEVVRTPEVTENGEPIRDRHGFVVWKKLENGTWDEDWTRLTHRERSNFLFAITTQLFDWEQRAVKLWSNSMILKAQWEERFADAYLSPEKGSVEGKTIESRTAFSKKNVAEDRYLAIYETTVSKRADAIVRTMSLLGQRLKDTITS